MIQHPQSYLYSPAAVAHFFGDAFSLSVPSSLPFPPSLPPSHSCFSPPLSLPPSSPPPTSPPPTSPPPLLPIYLLWAHPITDVICQQVPIQLLCTCMGRTSYTVLIQFARLQVIYERQLFSNWVYICLFLFCLLCCCIFPSAVLVKCLDTAPLQWPHKNYSIDS